MPVIRFTLILLALLPALALANTDAMQDASQLFRQGQHAHALTRIDAYLASNPKDAQGRFLKGLILTELNRYQEAIKVFSDLTTDYPQLPEPYNNLAVLYAAQGQYERAKQSLEQAIRTHPSYATAHENLGDIYAKMASLAYDKALQLDKSNLSAQTKLALIRDLFSPARGSDAVRTEAVKPAVARAPAKTSSRTPAAGKTADVPGREVAMASPEPAAPAVVGTGAASTPEPGPQISAEATRTDDAAIRPRTEQAAAGGSTPSPPASAPSPTEARAAVETTVQDWAKAWSRQDVAAYLSYYAGNFVPPRGQDRAAWEAERTQRVQAPRQIKVEVSDLHIEVKGDKAKARFRQRYEADHLKGTYRKTLDLELQDGQWKIVRER
ncbi:MAG: L,D-transpeptidase Cds6 family protein [Thiobacillaceae bacterium]